MIKVMRKMDEEGVKTRAKKTLRTRVYTSKVKH